MTDLFHYSLFTYVFFQFCVWKTKPPSTQPLILSVDSAIDTFLL